jgi:hypothetical protein
LISRNRGARGHLAGSGKPLSNHRSWHGCYAADNLAEVCLDIAAVMGRAYPKASPLDEGFHLIFCERSSTSAGGPLMREEQ